MDTGASFLLDCLEYNPNILSIKLTDYIVHLKDPIFPQDYADLPFPAAAKRITAKLTEILSDENNKEFIENYGND